MIIKAPYEHGSVLLNGREYYFQNFTCDVPNEIGKYLLSTGNYSIQIRNPLPLKDVNRLLFIRSAGLGDVLLCVPIVRYLKKHINPRMEVDWLCGSGEFASVLEGVPWIKRIYSRETLPDNAADIYNYLLSVDNAEFMDTRSVNTHRIDVFAWRCPELRDKIINDKHLEYYIKEEEKQWVNTLNIKHPFITITTQTTCFNRVLDDIQNQQICKKILDKGIGVVLLDKNRKEIYDPRAVNMQSKLSIRQTAAIIHCADAVLTPDTGILHLASAMDKKTLTYFGAMDPKYRLTSKNTITITHPIKCWPCHSYSCHNGNPDCVKKINVDEIVNKMVGLVAGK